MAEYTFRPAERRQAKLRMAIGGPPNSGKTFTALLLAKFLGSPIALIDTEHGSSQKYVGEREIPAFDMVALAHFSTEHYIAAIGAARQASYPVLIIDSLSHAWQGQGGILEHAETITISSKSRNAYTEGWRRATLLHNKMVDTILQYPGHVICTVRSKIARVQQDGGGVKIVGMEWVQRNDLEYEFDLAAEMDKLNTLVITKTRCRALNGGIFPKPGQELAQIIVDWLNEGAPTQTPEAAVAATPQASAKTTPKATHPPAGANGPHVNKADRQLESAKAEVIMTIIGALKAKFPGDDKTARQDRSDMSQELFGVPSASDLKALPLSLLQAGCERLTRPVIGERPTEPTAAALEAMEADVPVHAPPDEAGEMALVDGEPTDPRSGEVFRDVESTVAGVGDLDDETATESLLAQLTRYADSQGMVPAWQGLLQDYDAYRLEDGVLILTAEERETLLAQAAGLWPGVEDVVKLV